jgi:hypothetical protein
VQLPRQNLVREAVEVMEFEAGEMGILQSDKMAEFMEFEFLLDEKSEIFN